MSELNDANTVAVVTQGGERISKVLQLFSYQGAAWEDYPSMDEQFLEMLKVDLLALSHCIEARLQEKYQTHEPTDFGT